MEIVKISTPNWSNLGENNILITKLIPLDFSMKYRFYINEDVGICDYWFVFEGVKRDEKVFVRKAIIFYTTEETEMRKYDMNQLRNFDYILTSRKDFHEIRNKIIKTHYFNSWFVTGKYNDFLNNFEISKSKLLSTVTSNLNNTYLHIKRQEVIKILVKNLGVEFDVFGRGIKEIKNKEEGLLDYKFSIAIENSVIPDYFTEKLIDCYLTHTVPIYFGCPNISDYFDVNSMILIDDINDTSRIIEQVKNVIDDPQLYSSMIQKVIEAKNNYLNELSPFQVLNNVISKLENEETNVYRNTEYYISKEFSAELKKQSTESNYFSKLINYFK
jgi:hypothetical protein